MILRAKLTAVFAAGLLTLSVGHVAAAKQRGAASHHSVAVCHSHSASQAQCDAYINLRPNGSSNGPVSTVPIGYGPAEFHQAYNVPATSLRKNETIAIVSAFDNPNSKADLDVYDRTFNLPFFPVCSKVIKTSCYQKVTQKLSMQTNSSWIVESSLDVQTAHQMCQNCKILLVEAASDSDEDLFWANDKAVALGANVVNNSWGRPESDAIHVYDRHFNRPNVTFVASSGDNGYASHYPASSPYVTAVGGTTLLLDQSHNWVSETAWIKGGSFCSDYETKPSYQKDVACRHRSVVDVSADADAEISGAAIYDSFGADIVLTGWLEMGGTSLAAPLISGIYGLAGSTGRNNNLPYIHGSPANLHDVQAGVNGTCGTNICQAGPGYDGPTGLGTPNGLTAFQ